MALLIVVNGESRSLPGLDAPVGLGSVIAALGLIGDRVAVERNGAIAPRAGWREVMVEHGDRLEIVHFVGGGSQ